MITLLYFPTAMAVLDFGLPRKASNRRATVKSDLETALHHYPHSPLSLSTSSWRKPHNWGPEESREEKKAHSPAESTYDHRSGRLNNQKIQLGTQT
jgi:hypothetical protein